jgi:hypothetical protein
MLKHVVQDHAFWGVFSKRSCAMVGFLSTIILSWLIGDFYVLRMVCRTINKPKQLERSNELKVHVGYVCSTLLNQAQQAQNL